MLRVAKRLSDLYLARAWQQWVCTVQDNVLAAERDAHRATVEEAEASASRRREQIVSWSAARSAGRSERGLLHSVIECWAAWAERMAARRIVTMRVRSRVEEIWMRRVLRIWCLEVEIGSKNRERLEYTAIIDDAEDILAAQWESAVRQYLGRMDRLHKQRCIRWWMEWATARARRKNKNKNRKKHKHKCMTRGCVHEHVQHESSDMSYACNTVKGDQLQGESCDSTNGRHGLACQCLGMPQRLHQGDTAPEGLGPRTPS